MQILLDRSKYLIISILCCLSIVIYGTNPNVSSIVSIDNYDNADTPNSNSHDKQTFRQLVTPAAAHHTVSHNTVWKSLDADFVLDHRAQSKEVKAEIRHLLADRKKLNEILAASAPYIYFIHQQTSHMQLPAELALIPAIESEFNPNDHSTKGAIGLWQLMPHTAHDLGVKIKNNYDGRRNVVASTHAALLYFRDLGKLYKGNWYLAIAAYNCGQATLQSAIRRSGSHNFWNLSRLPRETKVYLPKLLAVAAIVEDPEKYNVQLPHIENQPYFSAVKLTKSVSFTKIANATGISITSLTALNPDYKRGVMINKNDNTLLVPIKYASTVQSHFSRDV